MVINLYDTVVKQPDYFRQLPCGKLLFTQYDSPQKTRITSAFSHQSFIAYVISGHRTYHQHESTYTLSPGNCVYCRKGGWLSEMNDGEVLRVMVLFIPDAYLQQFITEHKTQLPLRNPASSVWPSLFELGINDVSESHLQSMMTYLDQRLVPDESEVEATFRQFLFSLLTNSHNAAFLDYATALDATRKRTLQEIMDANFIYNLSLQEFSKLAQRSLAGFKREFKAVYNTSPGKWLIQKRLDYAQSLLKNSGKQVQDIAYESGFENSTHFSRVFKEKFGITPLHARRQASAN